MRTSDWIPEMCANAAAAALPDPMRVTGRDMAELEMTREFTQSELG